VDHATVYLATVIAFNLALVSDKLFNIVGLCARFRRSSDASSGRIWTRAAGACGDKFTHLALASRTRRRGRFA